MNRMIIPLILLVSQSFTLISCKKDDYSLNKIERKVVRIAKNNNIPSLAVSIRTKNDALDFSYHNKDTESQEIYGIGSATKFLSAVLVFKLIEENLLSLDDPIIDYIDSIDHIENSHTITVRNLLNHTSGLSDYSQHPDWIGKVTNNDPPISFEEKIVLVEPTLINSGTFSYSNTNYLFLERVVESITNKAYDTAFDEFYSNAGLSQIKMGNSTPNLQTFFAQTETASSNSSQWKEHHGFAGGAYANPKDLNDFLDHLFISKALLNDATITLMKEWISMQPMAIPIATGSIGEYGNGIMKLTYNEDEYIGHFGGTLQYQSFVFFNEKNEISISVTTNCAGRHYNNVFFQELIPEILNNL